jgi:type II secretion system protein G
MNRKGFTLIELLVVVVVIGILAALGIPKYASSKSKAYVTAMKSDLRNLLNAEETFFADSARYTTDLTKLKFVASSGVTPPVISVYAGAWAATNGHLQIASMHCAIGVNTANPLTAVSGEAEAACK